MPKHPPFPPPDDANPMERLLAIMACLRDPDRGCPWDIEQNFESIAPYTIEEAYEVADAIARADLVSLKDELGDLLLQVVYHSRMAEEAGHFDFPGVADAIAEKMLRRHPHVFGDARVDDAESQTRHWEDLKAEERAEAARALAGEPGSVLDGVPQALPALMRAEKLQKRAARVGFDWPEAAQVFAKIAEEIDEIKAELDTPNGQDRLESEIGDLLFAVANLARHLKVDPEVALRSTNRKFERRFRRVEDTFGADIAETTLEEMERAWQAAKSED